MSEPERVVIIGSGLAGGTAARTLRREGFSGSLTIVGSEQHPPYERPPLSKDYLRGESQRPDAHVAAETYWAEHDVHLVTGVAASRVDRGAGEVELTDGRRLGFDRLLLAPGAEPRRLPVRGSDLDGVVSLRTFGDADAIRDRAQAARRVLVVGGGWIASEVAASLRVMGHDVTMALRGHRPLERTLGADVADVYRRLHEKHGVAVLPATQIVAFDGDTAIRRAQTASGDWLDADLVVLAIGVAPRVELAEAAGLKSSNGIVVDHALATDDPRVFAAGDAALVPYQSLGRSLRVEHWGAAQSQGRHAARSILGKRRPYDELPYYFSDQYDTGMEFWADPALPGRLIVRGDLDGFAFTAFWHHADRVTAVLNMHVHRHDHEAHGEPSHAGHAGAHLNHSTVKRLLRSNNPIKVDELQDPDLPLEQLLIE